MTELLPGHVMEICLAFQKLVILTLLHPTRIEKRQLKVKTEVIKIYTENKTLKINIRYKTSNVMQMLQSKHSPCAPV